MVSKSNKEARGTMTPGLQLSTVPYNSHSNTLFSLIKVILITVLSQNYYYLSYNNLE